MANGLAVLAIGGNALIRDRGHESIPDQYEMVCGLAVDIAGMIETGSSVGLSEIGQGAVSTVDISETGSFNPNAQAFYGLP